MKINVIEDKLMDDNSTPLLIVNSRLYKAISESNKSVVDVIKELKDK